MDGSRRVPLRRHRSPRIPRELQVWRDPTRGAPRSQCLYLREGWRRENTFQFPFSWRASRESTRSLRGAWSCAPDSKSCYHTWPAELHGAAANANSADPRRHPRRRCDGRWSSSQAAALMLPAGSADEGRASFSSFGKPASSTCVGRRRSGIAESSARFDWCVPYPRDGYGYEPRGIHSGRYLR